MTIEETEKTESSEDKKDELLLDSLEIKGYRCFEHLTIEKLGRVNLIVGKNNVGKTALLEALWIYANHEDLGILHEIIFDRNETSSEKNADSHKSIREDCLALKHLLYNRPKISDSNLPKRKSPFFIISEAGRDLLYLRDKMFNLSSDMDLFEQKFSESLIRVLGSKTTFVICYYDSGLSLPQPEYFPKLKREINNFFIKSTGLSNDKLIEFWDEITLTPSEDKVIESLHILLQKLNRINMIAYPKGSKNRIPVVQVNNQNEPVPLKSFGDGMNRLFGISLALVNCKDGILLIDEIESGLHYSVLPDVWKLIFKTAKDLNVQVFATTHSYDCIEAFAQAAIDDEESKGNLIRLARKGDEIKAFTFDEKQLETITKEHIEVR